MNGLTVCHQLLMEGCGGFGVGVYRDMGIYIGGK
jgi:hypothetical protein